jgi:hypothetical protein
MDGHTDFRHPGNSAERYSLAGEDLAAAVGLAQLIPGRRMREAGPAATADAILLTDILASGLQHLGADRTG